MTPPQTWTLNQDHASPGQFAKFHKKHPREFASLFSNLEKVLNHLQNKEKLGTFKLGFFRSEGSGIFRISQSGVDMQESRLYIYPDEKTRTLYILGIGGKGKNEQQSDIAEAKDKVAKIKKLS